MYKKNLIVGLLLSCISIPSISQTPTPGLDKIKPVSPEVASFGKFIETPSGTYTGVPDISIPVYDVTSGKISIPLTLYYHAGGIKVNEEASWVGLGWNIFMGGFISQSLAGTEDALDHIKVLDGFDDFESRFLSGVANGRSELGQDAWACGNNSTPFDNTEIIHSLLSGNGQPDIYNFNFLGQSGKFYLDRVTGKPVVINNKQRIRFEQFSDGTGPSGWLVHTYDGVEYTFLKRAMSTESVNNMPATYTWYLTKIEGYDGTRFDFEYEQGYTESVSCSETYNSELPMPGTERHRRTIVHQFNDQFYLKAILTPTERVEFVLEGRDDIKGVTKPDGTYSAKRLKEIIVKDRASEVVKTGFEFDYTYFTYDNTGGNFYNSGNIDHLGKRLKLKSIKQFGLNSQNARVYMTPYEFSYTESIKLPLKTSFATDYWGYYNGQTSNTTSLPDLLPIYYPTGGLSTLPNDMINAPYRANRGPSNSHMKAFTLRQIKLPTGGYKVFNFEPHTFSNYQFYNAGQIVSSEVVRVASDKNTGSQTVVTLTQLETAVNVNFEVMINRGHPAQGLTFDDMKTSYAQLAKVSSGGSVTILKTWAVTDDMPTRTLFNQNGYLRFFEDIELTPEQNHDYKIYVYFPDSFGAQNTSTKTAEVYCRAKYPYFMASGSTQSYGGGLRIHSAELHDDNHVVKYKKRYEYEGGLLMSPPTFLSSRRFVFKTYSCGPPPPADPIFSMTTVEGLLWSTQSTSNISLELSANSGFIGYSSVTQLDGDVTINSKIRDEFFNAENLSTPGFPENPRYENGLLSKTTYLTPTDEEVKTIAYTYKSLPQFSRVGVGYSAEDTYIGPNTCNPCNLSGAPLYNPFIYNMRFILKAYPIKSEFHVIDSVIETSVFENGNVSVKKKYNYYQNAFLENEITVTSGDEVLRHEYLYPFNYETTYPYTNVQNLKSLLYYPVVEEKYLKNNLLLFQTLNEYKAEGTLQVLERSTVKNGASETIKYVKGKSFNAFGKPQELETVTGLPVVQIFGNKGTVLLATVTGATFSAISSLISVNAISEATNPQSLRAALIPLYSLSSAIVNVHVYNEKWLMVESIDQGQRSTFYSYDSLNRLVGVKDHDMNVLRTFRYHFKDEELLND